MESITLKKNLANSFLENNNDSEEEGKYHSARSSLILLEKDEVEDGENLFSNTSSNYLPVISNKISDEILKELNEIRLKIDNLEKNFKQKYDSLYQFQEFLQNETNFNVETMFFNLEDYNKKSHDLLLFLIYLVLIVSLLNIFSFIKRATIDFLKRKKVEKN